MDSIDAHLPTSVSVAGVSAGLPPARDSGASLGTPFFEASPANIHPKNAKNAGNGQNARKPLKKHKKVWLNGHPKNASAPMRTHGSKHFQPRKKTVEKWRGQNRQ